jgi:hypothetical protein
LGCRDEETKSLNNKKVLFKKIIFWDMWLTLFIKYKKENIYIPNILLKK